MGFLSIGSTDFQGLLKIYTSIGVFDKVIM